MDIAYIEMITAIATAIATIGLILVNILSLAKVRTELRIIRKESEEQPQPKRAKD